MKYLTIIFTIPLYFTLHAKQNFSTLSSGSNVQSPEMIIFVHGTLKPAEVSFSNLIKVMRNKIDNSIYCMAAQEIRKDPFFYQSQPIQAEGLQAIDTTSISQGARCIKNLYEATYACLGQDTTRLYYTFGWDGLLSPQRRYKAAKKLYKELYQELEKLAKKNIIPKITIIAFSHGANVVLNLAAVKLDDPILYHLPKNFFITNLVLLGAPIQKATDYLTHDPFFKNIINIYSTADKIQSMDIFMPRQLFSQQYFTSRKNLPLADKITQIRLRITGDFKKKHRKLHSDEILLHDIENQIIKSIHQDPGHTELWNFKWGAYWYRDTFPLNPLPSVILVPIIMHTIENYDLEKKHFTFDYLAPYGGAYIYEKKEKKNFIPLLSAECIEKLKTIAQQHFPQEYTLAEQQKRVGIILNKVRKTRKDLKLKNKQLLAYCNQSLLTNKRTLYHFPYRQKLAHAHLLRSEF